MGEAGQYGEAQPRPLIVSLTSPQSTPNDSNSQGATQEAAAPVARPAAPTPIAHVVRELASAITQPAQTRLIAGMPCDIGQAVVYAYPPLQVKIGGSTTAVPAKRIEGYPTPAVSDVVWVLLFGNGDLLVLGKQL